MRHAVAFLSDHEARSHRHCAAGRRGRADLATGGSLVTVEAVEDLAGLRPRVDVRRAYSGRWIASRRDFVKNRRRTGNLRLQDLQEVPR